MTVATNSHILVDDKGVARIDGGRMKVIHLVKAMVAQDPNAQQLCGEFPHLSLAQIHAALSFYYDHQLQIDAEIKKELAQYVVEKATARATPGRETFGHED